MPRNYNRYQYETSPRKIEPDYTPYRKKQIQKKSVAKKTIDKKEKEKKAKQKALRKRQRKVIGYILLSFSILFAICYRNSKIDEGFSEIQDLKGTLADIEKENSQLELSIEESLNFQNLEQQAKELLGMQKLTSSQITYVNLPKADYIEASAEEIIMEEDKNWWDNTKEFIGSLFK